MITQSRRCARVYTWATDTAEFISEDGGGVVDDRAGGGAKVAYVAECGAIGAGREAEDGIGELGDVSEGDIRN